MQIFLISVIKCITFAYEIRGRGEIKESRFVGLLETKVADITS